MPFASGPTAASSASSTLGCADRLKTALGSVLSHRRGDGLAAATIEEIRAPDLSESKLRAKSNPRRCILLITIYESDFDVAARAAVSILRDLTDTGFEEIWLADFKAIRDGAHRDLRLFGLHPEEFRVFSKRSIYDQKPYG